jgi:hypothetical protein
MVVEFSTFVVYRFEMRLLLSAAVAICVGALTTASVAQAPRDVAVIGRFEKGPVDAPVAVTAAQFESLYGSASPASWPAELQTRRFFAQGGSSIYVIRANPDGTLRSALEGDATSITGLNALPLVRDGSILVCPELTQIPPAEVPSALLSWKTYLAARNAMLILDPPPGLNTVSSVTQWVTANVPPSSRELVLYYPYLTASINGVATTFGASGTMAAAWLQNDALPGEGIWKSPAGAQLPLVADGMSMTINDANSDILSQASICPIRKFSGPIIPWGARHLDGANPENRYINVQRTLNWIRTSIGRIGILSASRENNSTLWSELNANVANFLQSQLYVPGALQGTTPNQAYFVQCGLGQTMTQADVNAHLVKLQIGVAMIQPSEFTILQFTWNTRDPVRLLPAPRLLMREGLAGKQLFYHTPPGASYKLTASDTLQPGSWIDFSSAVAGDDTWRKSGFTPTGGKRFFRSEQTADP